MDAKDEPQQFVVVAQRHRERVWHPRTRLAVWRLLAKRWPGAEQNRRVIILVIDIVSQPLQLYL